MDECLPTFAIKIICSITKHISGGDCEDAEPLHLPPAVPGGEHDDLRDPGHPHPGPPLPGPGVRGLPGGADAGARLRHPQP